MAAEISYRGRTSPAHAIAVAERLADEHDQEALYRYLEDATIEVAVMHKGVLTRHVVDDRGMTLAVESSPPSWKYRSETMVAGAGVLVFAAGFVFAAVRIEEKPNWIGWLIFLPFVALVVSGYFRQAGKLQARLGGEEWKPVPALGGWQPRTREQLQAIETLLDERQPRARPALRHSLDRGGRDDVRPLQLVSRGREWRYHDP